MLLLLKELVMKKDVLLKQVATKLFYEQGWILTSVAEICRAAGVSRVTFYKYFPTKQALVKCIFEEQKNKMREDFDNLLDTQSDLSQIITKILSMQQDSMETLYSVPVLHDLHHEQDRELRDFFKEMEEEKYQYMHYFFGTLQKRKIIRDDFPVMLIDLFIQKIDEILNSASLQSNYKGREQKLFKDVLQLFMCGIRY